MTLAWRVSAVLLVAYLPGALMFRLPFWDRPRRASLPAEERVFWAVVLSVTATSCTALALAAGGWYRFDRLLWIDGGAAALALLVSRGRLMLGAAARQPGWTALLPIALVAGGLFLDFFVPPAEYVMGGKDPGAYMNEGIQIAQHGSLVIADEVARAVPPDHRRLFFGLPDNGSYFGSRFMGFFLLDADKGTVVGQFPHLYPVWIAVAYGVEGLSGAREILGLWAVLGLVAVYFAGAPIMGRAASAAGAGLLTVHVMQIWYARYPNAELVMQPLVFAGLLAFWRSEMDRDRFFAPVAAVLLALGVFAHLSGVFVAGAVAAAALVGFVEDGRLRLSFVLPLVAGTAIVLAYLASYIPPYFQIPAGFVKNLRPSHLLLIGLAVLGGLAIVTRARRAPTARTLPWMSGTLTAAVLLFAGYAYFFRRESGSLASSDADSLRMFASFYLSPSALVAALIGFTLLAGRLPSSAAFLLTVAAFSFVFFYKIRVVPEHFWAARRFLPVILPGSLLLVGAAAFTPVRSPAALRLGFHRRSIRVARYAAGLVFVVLLGWRFVDATRPILRHVEYAGLIPHVERLAGILREDDLVLVEARGASDVHVLALPLAYIYARQVLVFVPTDPERHRFADFLGWAQKRYGRVLFIGSGGTRLLSRTVTAERIAKDQFVVPEYESADEAYPRGVKYKAFSFGVYELLTRPTGRRDFDVDVGDADELYVRRFHAQERRPSGFTFRWTRDVSYVSIVGTGADQRQLTIWMSNGGRPAPAGPAQVTLFLNDRQLGVATVGNDLQPYLFEVPRELTEEIDRSDSSAELRLLSTTWNPAHSLGTADDRDLGVIVDRIELK